MQFLSPAFRFAKVLCWYNCIAMAQTLMSRIRIFAVYFHVQVSENLKSYGNAIIFDLIQFKSCTLSTLNIICNCNVFEHLFVSCILNSYCNFDTLYTNTSLQKYCEFYIAIICWAYWKTCNWFCFIVFTAVCVNLNDITQEFIPALGYSSSCP